jgi:hypothetical protein
MFEERKSKDDIAASLFLTVATRHEDLDGENTKEIDMDNHRLIWKT